MNIKNKVRSAVSRNVKHMVSNSRCPKCGRKSLVVEKDGWVGAKPRTTCGFAGCMEVVNDAEKELKDGKF